ncbi:MAG: hypothetical protein GMKNLPBB_00288 [Myxococcota bacterium]|nr:hypothetical protein [Myxococcota bacterium]
MFRVLIAALAAAGALLAACEKPNVLISEPPPVITILDTSPSGNSTNADPSSPIVIVFGVEMDSASFGKGLVLESFAGGTRSPVEILSAQYSDTTKTVVLTPKNLPMAECTIHILKMTTELKSKKGDALLANIEKRFRTGRVDGKFCDGSGIADAGALDTGAGDGAAPGDTGTTDDTGSDGGPATGSDAAIPGDGGAATDSDAAVPGDGGAATSGDAAIPG